MLRPQFVLNLAAKLVIVLFAGGGGSCSGLLIEAITALAMAGKRHLAGGHIRLDGQGIQAVRAVLEDYAAVLAALPERVMVQCHRDTERRLRAILAGKRQPHDVEVMAI